MINIKYTNKQMVERIIALAGGQQALANLIGAPVKKQHVWTWLHRQKRIPAKRVDDVARALKKTGFDISPVDIRPDLEFYFKHSESDFREIPGNSGNQQSTKERV